MHLKTCTGIALFFLIASLFAAPTLCAQTDLAISLYGAFSGATNGNGVQQSPSNSAGGILELRHISNPLVGYEATYSYNRANQVYTYTEYGCPALSVGPCGPPPAAPVSANAHEIAGDWVVSVHGANLRPFALAGAGVLLNEPASGQAGAASSNKAVFLYGAGLDWGLLPHLGLRFQYRGNVYKAPDVTTAFSSTNAFAHTSEPMIGAYLRF